MISSLVISKKILLPALAFALAGSKGNARHSILYDLPTNGRSMALILDGANRITKETAVAVRAEVTAADVEAVSEIGVVRSR